MPDRLEAAQSVEPDLMVIDNHLTMILRNCLLSCCRLVLPTDRLSVTYEKL